MLGRGGVSPAGSLAFRQAAAAGANHATTSSSTNARRERHQARAGDRGGRRADLSENPEIGVATVHQRPELHDQGDHQKALFGAAPNKPIGYAPERATGAPRGQARRGGRARRRARQARRPSGDQPQAVARPTRSRRLQWDMKQIGATADGSYASEQGATACWSASSTPASTARTPTSRRTSTAALSRNFTVDIPIDRRRRARTSPTARATTRPTSTRTATARTWRRHHRRADQRPRHRRRGARRSTLVNLRAGQDSGYFFLQPTVDALTYAGDNGIDVVNMSYYIDPWLYNCADNPADSPAEQAGAADDHRRRRSGRSTTRTTTASRWSPPRATSAPTSATRRRRHRARTSPVPGAAHPRTSTTTCLDHADRGQPRDRRSAATGPSGARRTTPTTASADRRVGAGRRRLRHLGNAADIARTRPVLAPYPRGARREPAASSNPRRHAERHRSSSATASGGTCAYYQYLQGTSMASPHAVGVAALIVGSTASATG